MASDAEIRNLRLFMEAGPDAMTYELAHNAETVGLDQFLNGRAHIADRVTHPDRLDPPIQRCFCDFQQLLHVRRHVSYRDGDSGVTVIAIKYDTTIDRNYVARLEHPLFRRDTVHDLLVDRSAQHARVIVITLKGRLRAEFLDLLLGRPFQVHRAHARGDQAAHIIEYLPYDAATVPHLLNFRLRLAYNRHSKVRQRCS